MYSPFALPEVRKKKPARAQAARAGRCSHQLAIPPPIASAAATVGVAESCPMRLVRYVALSKSDAFRIWSLLRFTKTRRSSVSTRSSRRPPHKIPLIDATVGLHAPDAETTDSPAASAPDVRSWFAASSLARIASFILPEGDGHALAGGPIDEAQHALKAAELADGRQDLLPIVGFIAGDDPRVRSTIEATWMARTRRLSWAATASLRPDATTSSWVTRWSA